MSFQIPSGICSLHARHTSNTCVVALEAKRPFFPGHLLTRKTNKPHNIVFEEAHSSSATSTKQAHVLQVELQSNMPTNKNQTAALKGRSRPDVETRQSTNTSAAPISMVK